jgi:hypothetical protein
MISYFFVYSAFTCKMTEKILDKTAHPTLNFLYNRSIKYDQRKKT